jgi:hypothetical protein
LENIAQFCMEQSQKNTARLFDLMKDAATSSVQVVTWAQGEAQQVANRLNQQGAEQFVAQLEKIQAQQLAAQQEFQEQFRNLLNLFHTEGK